MKRNTVDWKIYLIKNCLELLAYCCIKQHLNVSRDGTGRHWFRNTTNNVILRMPVLTVVAFKIHLMSLHVCFSYPIGIQH